MGQTCCNAYSSVKVTSEVTPANPILRSALEKASLITINWFRNTAEDEQWNRFGEFVNIEIGALVVKYHDFVRYPSAGRTLSQHIGWIRCSVVSSDGLYLFTGSDDRTIVAWDLNSYAMIRQWDADQSQVLSMAFANGTLVSGGHELIQVWNARDLSFRRSLKGHTSGVMSMDFDNDGKCLVSGSWDHSIRVWNVYKGQCIAELRGHSGIVSGVCFIRDSVWVSDRYIVSGSYDESIMIWNHQTKDCLKSIDNNNNNDPISDGGQISSLTAVWSSMKNDTLISIILDTSIVIRTLNNADKEVFHIIDVIAQCQCFYPLNPMLLAMVVHSGNSIKVFNLEQKKFIDWSVTNDDYIRDLCFTPNGQKIITVSDDWTVRVINFDQFLKRM